MRLGPPVVTLAALAAAATGCWFAATAAVDFIEETSSRDVETALMASGHDWAEVHVDGLQVHIGGDAPDEAVRFNALSVASNVVDSERVVDGTTVTPDAPLVAPSYSIEILRNNEGVTLIGLVPASFDRTTTLNEIAALAQGAEITDLLEIASYPEPENWEGALDFGLNALARLPRAKVSISADRIDVEAIAESLEQKAELEQLLQRRVPDDLDLRIAISAPRPVIAPFTLRFVIDDAGARFDACSADTTRDRNRILDVAKEAGMTGDAECPLGLGVPSREWSNAVIQGIRALAELGHGSITFSDADVSLIAEQGTLPGKFDQVVGELESNLPAVFSLHSVLPEPEAGSDSAEGPPEFVATRSPEGQVQLRGRLNNDLVRSTVQSFARARFGVDSVHTAARIDTALPDSWPTRVLAGLQSLAQLESGAVVVTESRVDVRGVTGNTAAEAEITRLLAEKLGGDQDFGIEVRYEEALDPLSDLPSPQECVDKVNTLLTETKITFSPGSTDIEGPAVQIVDGIADILKACSDVDMMVEIAGHTDSQGREQMNLNLSQDRANAVLEALMARRVLASKMSAQGYGESEPIADNETDEGREANRRIEFRLTEEAAQLADKTEETEQAEEAEQTEGQPSQTPENTDGEAGVAEDADAAESTDLDATTGAADAGSPQAEANDDGTEESQ